MNATQSPVVTVGSVRDTLCSQNCIFCCWRHWLHPARCAGLASDTPVVQSCQSVTRQSEEPRQYILCSPNTVNTEYISAPNTHVGLAHCIPTYSTNTKFWSATILAEYNSRIEARRLLHSSFLRTIASIALSSQMSIAPIFYDMTHPKKSPLILLKK